MDSEISGTVLSATPRVTGNGKTVYDIAFSDGNTYATFDAKIWAKVQAVGQQPASARVSVKQNGNYTNFYLNDIAPQGQLAATSAPVATAAPQAVPQPARPQGGMSAEDKARVTWLSCLSSAAQGLVAGLDKNEILGIAVGFYEFTARSGYKVPEQSAARTPVEGPNGVAGEPVAAGAAVNDSAGDNGKGDGIPW